MAVEIIVEFVPERVVCTNDTYSEVKLLSYDTIEVLQFQVINLHKINKLLNVDLEFGKG